MLLLSKIILSACISVAIAFPLVISEVLWVGSPYSTADEWFELRLHPTFTGSVLPLNGYELWANNGSGQPSLLYAFTEADVLYAGTPFVVANYNEPESAISIAPNVATTAISLPNTGLLVWLQTSSGTIIDMVDDGIGAPFAGGKLEGNTVFTSMERIDLTVSGQVPANWVSAIDTKNIDPGVLVRATPGVAYSVASSTSSSEQSSSSDGSSPSSSDSSSSSEDSSSSQSTSSLSSDSSVSSEQSSSSSSVAQVLFISELLPNPVGSDNAEWIEITNTTDSIIQVFDLTLADTSGSVRALTASGVQVLEPFGTQVFIKAENPFTLKNSSGTVSLMYQNDLQDTLFYPEAPDGISWGRQEVSTHVTPYCNPTPGTVNTVTSFTPIIDWQTMSGIFTDSGTLLGTGSLTINMQIFASGSVMTNAMCTTIMSDGWSSDSCNPPSHTIAQSGTGQIITAITNYCGTTVEHLKEYIVANTTGNTGGGAQNSSQIIEHKCSSIVTGGIRISEAMPNPIGDEIAGEWIELWNQNSYATSLCGWQLDDAEGGSKLYDLSALSLAPNSYVLLPRSQTAIALNNSNEQVRLFAPTSLDAVEHILVDSVEYTTTIEGESYALRSDGAVLWTPFTTPGEPNMFRTAERRFETDTVVVSAALPNPDGKDSKANEWLEVTNVSDALQNLSGWQLDDMPGGSAPYTIESLWLEPGQTQRLNGTVTGIELGNTYDEARLLDPDGYSTSAFSWQDAVSGYIYRLPRIRTEKVWAQVVQCIDGDTIKIAFDTPDDLRLLPPEVKRAWLAIAEQEELMLTVRLLGIDSPETVHPFKPLEPFGKEASDFTCITLGDKRIQVQFDEVVFDAYNRLLAYVYIHGTLHQSSLLRSGLATAYTRFPFALQDAFINYEYEARTANLGMWRVPQILEYLQQQKEVNELELELLKGGLNVTATPASGRVAYGSGVVLHTNVPSSLFVSVSSGTYIPYTGPITITGASTLQAYAVYTGTGSEPLTMTSTVLTTHYSVVPSSYSNAVTIAEVYPSPRKGEDEWIELYNPTPEFIDLADYILDDTEDAGSKPFTIPWNNTIAPHSSLLFTKELTGITLNNSNDSIALKDPNGTLVHTVQYGKVPKGKSVVFSSTNPCTSDVPTPAVQADCITLSTKKTAVDNDFDGLPDDHEVHVYFTSPILQDTDGDGYYDGFEITYNLDPLMFTLASRDARLLYTKFVQESVSIKFKEYKTVDDKLTVQNKLPFSVQVELQGQLYTVPAASKQTIALGTLEPGQYTLRLQLPSALQLVENTVAFTVSDSVVKKVKKAAKSTLPTWAKFTERFLVQGSTVLSTNTDLFSVNRQADLSTNLKQNFSYSWLVFTACFLGMVCCLLFWYWRRM